MSTSERPAARREAAQDEPRTGSVLRRLALHRTELRAWAMYDWANSAVWTTVIAAVFPIYFSEVAAAGLPKDVATTRFALATTASLLFVAVLAPVLGAVADFNAIRKRLLAGFVIGGVVATACMCFIGPGDWVVALVLFMAVDVAVSGSIVFYDALLPHVARKDETDRLSTTGFALGYLGGGVLLALNLAWIRWPQGFGLSAGDPASGEQSTLPVRLAFVSVAVWWAVFSIPLFRNVREPARQPQAGEPSGGTLLTAGFTRLWRLVAELRRHPQALLMLLAFLIYSDAIGTIIRMATIYGSEIGIGRDALIASILLVQFVGVPFALLFGRLATWIGAKPAILIGLAAYTGICVYGYFLRTASDFVVLAVLVGVVQGGTQALSRSLFASLIPKHRSAAFFGLFSTSERFAGIVGPAIFAAVTTATGSSRHAIVSLIPLFAAGALLLSRVDVAAGRRAAEGADTGDQTPPTRDAAAVGSCVPWSRHVDCQSREPKETT